MGMCTSKSEEQLAAEKLDAELSKKARMDHEEDTKKIKLLLLGAGESGKSTIFKQMKILYGEGFKDDDRKLTIPVVHSNTIASMKVLVQTAEDLGLNVAAENEESAEMLSDISEDAPLDEALAARIAALWKDPAVQETYEKRATFQLNDSAAYFFKKVMDTCKSDYLPSIKDVLQLRVRTSGIVEEEYSIDGVQFAMYDVGGQRNERKKWIHCFDEVTAVIFVAAISEYDQVLYEDASQNRMVESLNLFHEICNSKWFENTTILLFLNKRDLFEEKITHVDLRLPDPADPSRMLWDDYEGGCNYDTAVEYIVAQYLAQNDSQGSGQEIVWHVTCATDTSNVSTVFNTCKEIILKKNIEGSGFME